MGSRSSSERTHAQIGHFLDVPGFVKLVEPSIGVRLQRPTEVTQMPFWVLALAIGRVSKPHRQCRRISRRAIIAHVRPQPAGARVGG